MNYKIEYNFLEITNSPAIEYYFEKRAREGWLIHQIYLGSIFIFKKIEPAELSFLIKPYELPDENWTYVTDSYDLFIYHHGYKPDVGYTGIEAVNEFEILEVIGKKRIQGNMVQIFLLLMISWFNVSGIYTSPDFLKDGAAQLILPLVLVGLTIAGWGIIHMRRFLKRNRERIESGKDILNSDSLYIVPSVTFFMGSILIILFTVHFLYVGVISRSFIPFILLLVFISFLAGERGYRIWQQSDRTDVARKKMGWLGSIFIVALVGAIFGIYKESGIPKNPDLAEYKVLTVDTFPDGQLEIEGSLYSDFSILIPKSYEYYYISDESEYVETKYARALLKDFAIDLTKRYLEEKKRDYSNFYSEEIKLYFDEGIFDDYLTNVGINEEDLIRLKGLEQEDAEKVAKQLIKERSITQADANLWNADEAYFLSYTKNRLLIRKGREVFYLAGKDFTDAEVIEKTKARLMLN